MSNPRVKCSVDQCTHYMPGEYCQAARIDIYNEEDGRSVASTSDQTLCKSFHKRKTVGDMIGTFSNINVGGIVSAMLPGQQITPEVKCFVNSCDYWSSGNYCHSADIHVNGPNAGKNEDTDCHTFKPRSGK